MVSMRADHLHSHPLDSSQVLWVGQQIMEVAVACSVQPDFKSAQPDLNYNLAPNAQGVRVQKIKSSWELRKCAGAKIVAPLSHGHRPKAMATK